MRRRIGEIVDELKEVIVNSGLQVSEETIFQEALTTYRGEQMGKNTQPSSKPDDNLITPKQKYYLDKNKAVLEQHGFSVSNVKTKAEASKIIEEFKKVMMDDKGSNY